MSATEILKSSITGVDSSTPLGKVSEGSSPQSVASWRFMLHSLERYKGSLAETTD